MASLDAFLDFVIPPAIFLVFGFMIYRAFGDEFRKFGRWIKKLMTPKEEEYVYPKESNWYQ